MVNLQLQLLKVAFTLFELSGPLSRGQTVPPKMADFGLRGSNLTTLHLTNISHWRVL
jgi:hypothetical protein